MSPHRPLVDAGPALLGAILAGGLSRRFGSPKADAPLSGASLLEHARDLLSPLTTRLAVVGGDSGSASRVGLDLVPDETPGLGPIGGLATALSLAQREGLDGSFVLACDTPLIEGALLRDLLALWDGHSVLVPESKGPLGVEPLCGVYPVAALPQVLAASRASDRSMGALLDGVTLRALPLSRVQQHGDPDVLFLNINRPGDLSRAEAVRERPRSEPTEP